MTTEPGKVLVIDGSAIDDIASFYRELNHVFMQGEEWTLGQSLDALNDLLYGGYGAIDGREPVTLRWQASAHSRQALGIDATARFYQHKLLSPQHYNVEQIKRALATLEAGTGSTYFDLVLEIIAEHPNITLLLE